MKTIALSVFGDRISSRLDVSEKVMIVKVENNSIKTKELRFLNGMDTLKKLDALVQLKPDILICGGITDLCKKKLSNNKIRILPWVQGDTEHVLRLYLDGLLSNKSTQNFMEI
jgi:predicted Fe-Mo cluster-binding NifX family protein